LGEVFKKEGLKPETYIWFAKNFEDSKLQSNAVILNAVAICYAKGGDYTNAFSWQEKAVAAVKIAVKDNSLAGYVRTETITEYENLLAEYKKKKE
ncbi:hypothetical protein, partial [Sediminibacterium sp.]|uniref:hypothetical protein n=1 Tax=Sediminibacterium sp. TaxID=1917865 RepID=UPI003F69EA7D